MRSANTFSVIAFKYAQERPVRMANGLHASAQIVLADKLKIPAVVLVRHPEDVVLSRIVSHNLSIRQALLEYIEFYDDILERDCRFVLAPFSIVTSDYGSIIDRVNHVYRMQFGRFMHSKEDMQTVFKMIANYQHGIPIHVQAMPNAEKDEMKRKARHRYYDEDLSKWRTRAESLYRLLTGEETK